MLYSKQSLLHPMATAAVLCVCLSLLPPVNQACYVVGRIPTPHTMHETLYKASIVLSATASMEKWIDRDGSEREYPAFYTVDCIFNNSVNANLSAGSTFMLNWNFRTSCDSVWPGERGKKYILGLREPTEEYHSYFDYIPGMYILDEPYVMEPAVFDATPLSLYSLLKVCGLQQPVGEACPEKPKGTVNAETGEEEEDEKCIEAVYNTSSTITASLIITSIVAVFTTL